MMYDQKKAQKEAARQEAILTITGVIFILVLTIGTVLSFEFSNEHRFEIAQTMLTRSGDRG